MARGRLTKCQDCGNTMKALRREFRPICGRCKRRHHPKRKTMAIVRFFRRRPLRDSYTPQHKNEWAFDNVRGTWVYYNERGRIVREYKTRPEVEEEGTSIATNAS